LSRGRGGFVVSDGANSCKGHGGNANASAEVAFATRLGVVTTGSHEVIAKVNLNISGYLSVKAGSCPVAAGYVSWWCDGAVYWAVGLNGGPFVRDDISGATIWLSNNNGGWYGFLSGSFDNLTDCPYGRCSNSTLGAEGNFSLSLALTWYFNGTMYRTHNYSMHVDFYGWILPWIQSNGGVLKHWDATGVLGFGKFGNGLTVRSITIR
jgi:hypothetical protein